MRRTGTNHWRRRRAEVAAAGLGVIFLASLLLPACRAPGDMRSSNPYERASAVVQRAEAGDAQAVHQMVALLEDDDPGVRLYAIMALRRLCDADYGYRYYAPPPERARAAERWRAALQAGEVRLRSRPATTTPPAHGAPRG